MGSDLNSAAGLSLVHQSVLIVGCGSIAGGFDEKRQNSSSPYTHAGAYLRDGRFDLIACVEPDERRRSEFVSNWNIPAGYRSIEEALESGKKFDIISICTPTSNHVHDLQIALRFKPKLIFCEKPITTSFVDSERLVSECLKANILLAVNFTRRWDPDILKLQTDIDAGLWGQLRSAVGLYNKGLLNNGSHMLDLMHILVGPMKILNIGKPVPDFFQEDQSVPVWLEGPRGVPVHLACAHAEDYAVFELQLIFSRGILTMEEGGMFWRERHVVDSETFEGYRKLEKGKHRTGNYPRSMLCAVDNIYRAISQDKELASTGTTALPALRLCEDIKHQSCAR